MSELQFLLSQVLRGQGEADRLSGESWRDMYFIFGGGGLRGEEEEEQAQVRPH